MKYVRADVIDDQLVQLRRFWSNVSREPAAEFCCCYAAIGCR